MRALPNSYIVVWWITYNQETNISKVSYDKKPQDKRNKPKNNQELPEQPRTIS